MNRFFSLLAALALMLLCVPVFPAQAEPLRIIAGTSLIEDIVHDLTDRKAEVVTIINGSSCPGHESARTTDFVFAAKANLVLIHAFQENMPQITSMLESVNKADRRLVILEPKGSWLIPAIQKTAVNDIAEALVKLAPDLTDSIRDRAAKRLERIDAAADEATKSLEKIKGRHVIVAEMQSEFVGWAGVAVAATYGRAEEMTPKALAELVDSAKDKNIAGVVDNYQSGAEAGLPLALELKVPHLVLSNFPGSSEDAMDYFSLLRHNVKQLLLLAS